MAQCFKAAFDFGSGATKMALARVAATTGEVLEVLYEEERSVLLGDSMAASGTKKLISEAVISELFSALNDFTNIIASNCQDQSAVRLSGIATAVYREANNGPELMQLIRDRYGIPMQILPQAEEAKLGFLTGCGLVRSQSHLFGDSVPARLMVWDSGGASFQISLGETLNNSLTAIFNGSWGSSKVLHCFMSQIQQRNAEELSVLQGGRGEPTVNPVSVQQFEALVKHLKDAVTPTVPAWVHAAAETGVPLVTIGGATNCFRVCTQVLKTNRVHLEDIMQAAPKLCDMTDNSIREATGVELQLYMTVPKMALVAAVMQSCGFTTFTYFRTTGSTLGMMQSPALWDIAASI